MDRTRRATLSRYSVVAESRRLEWANTSSMYVLPFQTSRCNAVADGFTLIHLVQYYRTIPFDALLGGAEDVLADLGVRQALRQMPKNAKL